MKHLKFDHILIPYQERKSSRAKRIIISMDKERVRISIPTGVNVREARQFVQSKREWIIEHWQHLQEKELKQLNLTKTYKTGDQLTCGDGSVILQIATWERKRAAWRQERGNLLVYLPSNLEPSGTTGLVSMVVADWYKARARQVFAARLDFYAVQMGVEYRDLRVKDQKTRWGSCSTKGNINLNWHLVLAPAPVIDYVVVHELAHRKFLNHSSEFWQFVKAYIPDYLEWRKWLHNNGRNLVR